MLYLLTSKRESPAYDVYLRMLVRADNEVHARTLAGTLAADEGPQTWWYDEYSTCELVEPNEGPIGVVIADFNAG